MGIQNGYGDVGCQSCGEKAKGSSHGQAGVSGSEVPASVAQGNPDAFGDDKLKNEYKSNGK